MMIALLVLALGLVLYFVPSTSAPGGNSAVAGKVNTFGLVLIFCGVFFALAAFSGRSLRVADLDAGPAAVAVLNDGSAQLRRQPGKDARIFPKRFLGPPVQRDVIDTRETIARVLFTSSRHTSRSGDGLEPQPA